MTTDEFKERVVSIVGGVTFLGGAGLLITGLIIAFQLPVALGIAGILLMIFGYNIVVP